MLENIRQAIHRGDTAQLQTLLAGVKKDVLNQQVDTATRRTLLHVAAAAGNEAAVKLLVSRGANVNARDACHDTPLACAPDTREGESVRAFLVHNGAIADAAYYHKAQPHEKEVNEEDTGDFIDKTLLRRAFIMFLLPFVYLLVSNGVWFCLQFVAATVTFYYIGAGYFVSEVTIKPPWYHPQPGADRLTLTNIPDEWGDLVHDPKQNLGIDFEHVSFSSPGGYTLRGWYVPAAPGKQSPMGIVFGHGGGRDRRSWMRHLPMFRQAGFACLLFDFREHGLSSGNHRGLSYGMKERFDVRAAAEYMRDAKGFKRIAAIGTSMGGSSVIMAAALDADLINVVVAENPLMTCAHLQQQHITNLIGGYFRHTLWSRMVFGIFQRMCSNWLNLKVGNKPSRKCQSRHVIDRISPRPLLLLHGTYDKTIPYSHSQELFDRAAEPKELWLVPGAIHCGLYDKAPTEYEKRVIGFLRKFENA